MASAGAALPPARWPRAGAGRALRAAATGLAFAGFGLGAVALSLVVFPLCRATAPSPARADARVQRVIHRAFRAFLRIAESAGLVRTRWIGVDALRAPGARIVVANHPTLIDVVQLVAVLPQADCIVNDARTRNPFLALAARAAGYLSNAQGADLVDACAARLRQGRTVILFPEGTRSPATGLHPFHRGAAHVALATGAPIVPVAIRCEPRTLQKGRPFWEVPDGAPHFTLRVLEPVTVCADDGLPPGVAARRTTALLRSRLEAWAG